jgi:hypothetical protein
MDCQKAQKQGDVDRNHWLTKMPVTLELVYLEMKIASPFRLQYNEVD